MREWAEKEKEREGKRKRERKERERKCERERERERNVANEILWGMVRRKDKRGKKFEQKKVLKNKILSFYIFVM